MCDRKWGAGLKSQGRLPRLYVPGQSFRGDFLPSRAWNNVLGGDRRMVGSSDEDDELASS